MATTENADRIKSLELAIEEQRRDYDVLERLYDKAQTKNITFLSAGLVLLGFLYGNVPDGHATLARKLFIPKEPYGVIVYALSLTLYLFSIAMLLFALKPRKWSTAYDNDQDDEKMKNYERYLTYMQQRYIRASRVNGSSYAQKQSLLDMSFIPLLTGGILLLLLKTFGG